MTDKTDLHPGQAWRVGLGAGILGAALVALKYALRPPTKRRVPETISPAIFKTKVLHTSLGQVVYHECGSGQTLIFIHDIGVGASSFEWSRVYPHFAARYRVIALDLAGFGESARPAASFTAADYVRMLGEFARALHWEQPPVWIGSGFGGGLTASLASQHSELVSRLILHMPHGGGHAGPRRHPLLTRLIYGTPLLARFAYRNHLSTRPAVAEWLRKSAFANPALVTEEITDVFATCAQQPSAEYAALSWLAGGLDFDLEGRLRQLPPPLALLWSTDVPTAPLDHAYALQKLAPGATMTVFPKAGRLAALEVPEEMIAVLEEQLQGDLRELKAG